MLNSGAIMGLTYVAVYKSRNNEKMRFGTAKMNLSIMADKFMTDDEVGQINDQHHSGLVPDGCKLHLRRAATPNTVSGGGQRVACADCVGKVVPDYKTSLLVHSHRDSSLKIELHQEDFPTAIKCCIFMPKYRCR
jgi:hypothetical protein